MIGRAAHIRILEHLTKRQRQVLLAVAEGKTNAEIGASLGLTVLDSGRCSGVEFHLSALKRCTKLQTIAELTRLAVRLGIVDTEP